MLALRDTVGTFAYRILGAAVLDRSVFEGIEHDRAATRQAALVIIGSAVAAGVGASGWNGPSPVVLLGVTGLALVTWVAWAAIILQIGGRSLPEAETQVDLGQLLRTIGFAASPGFLQVFACLPGMTNAIFVASWVWMLAAMTVAVRQALDFRSMNRALAVCAAAFGLVLAMAWALALLLISVVA